MIKWWCLYYFDDGRYDDDDDVDDDDDDDDDEMMMMIMIIIIIIKHDTYLRYNYKLTLNNVLFIIIYYSFLSNKIIDKSFMQSLYSYV